MSSSKTDPKSKCEVTKDGKHRIRTFIRRGPGDRMRLYPRCAKCGYEPNNQAPQRAASAVAACSDSTNSANPETNNAKGKT